MASEVGICNRALQKLGAKRITSLSEDSVNARACNVAFESLRDFELREHSWSFAIKRSSLAADSVAPAWGRANSFQLPSDCLKVLPPYPEMNRNDIDWQIEGRKILTNDKAPLLVRYIAQVIDPNEMDAAFKETLACRIALELCEEITQSNTKKDALLKDYEMTVRRAKKANAIENAPGTPPEDTWVTGRS